MDDSEKTKKELIHELSGLRRRVAELEAWEAEQKRMAEALRRSEERYRAVTETAFAGIGITDPDENMVFVNPAFVQMLGYTQEELEGMNLSRLTDRKEFARYQAFTQQRREGVENYYETRVYRKDGAVLNVLVSATPLTAGDGSFEGTLAVVIDITERKRAEEALERAKEAYTEQLVEMVRERTRELEQAQVQLIQSEKLAAMGKLAAGVAHEVNNPAGTLLMKLNFLLSIADREKLSLRAVSTLNVAVEQVERIARIVRSLLSFSRQAEGKPAPTEINRAVENALTLSEPTFSSQKINLCVHLEKDLPRVVVDPTELEQVALNLLNNAVDAMPGGGRLSITSSKEDSWVCLRVEDTGMGIPEADLHRVFDPFFTTKQVGEGTGLGLSVSYGIVEKMGGRIDVESVQGRGTIFTVRLPVQRG